jgi:L-seryl-tRNA(Ser) seleniumtransferase
MPERADRPPSVDALARSLTGLPHPLLVDAARAAIAAGAPDRAAEEARRLTRRMLTPVINATGVLLHTNLGRAPLAVSTALGYTNLELDLETGWRGDRSERAGALLARACGADAALVVNNGAAAVLLALAALARGRDAVVSRGEEVEIGGGFRIPEVMATSGARVVEVGTTNRTRRADYEAVLADPARDVAVLLKVHRSNYRISGFTEEVSVRDLAGLGAPVVVDLGSGLLDAATPWLAEGPPAWLQGEPAVRQTLEAGAVLVAFSGDKLLGGPQAGILAGSAEAVAACARHPLARALRPGGLVLAALQQVALAYLDRNGDAIPFWRMATTPVEELRARALRLREQVPPLLVVEASSTTGGGTLPGVAIPSAGVALAGDHVAALRAHDLAVIARVERTGAGGRTVADLRTVLPEQDSQLAEAMRAVATPL